MSGTGAAPLTLTFRCPTELEGIVPAPTPAQRGLPGWLKAMPRLAHSDFLEDDFETVKRCPPFIDAMSYGFLMPLMCEVRVENGEFAWDNDLPAGRTVGYARSPMSFHDSSQVVDSPLFEADQSIIKFHNTWTIQAPEGYSLLFTHPVNRFDLPFRTLTGLVDCDRYHDAWIHFPARWSDATFSGVLPRGTPIAQCIPVKREAWVSRIEAFDESQTQRTHNLMGEIERERGVYRRDYRH